MRNTPRYLALSFLVAAGCAEQFPLPMTAAQFAQHNSGPALMAYLSQPDASPGVCDLRARGPHLTDVGPETIAAFGDGLYDGVVPPPLWRRCVEALQKDLPPSEQVALQDQLGKTYRRLLRSKKIESDTARQGQLATLHELFLERPHGRDANRLLMDRWLAELDRAIERKRLGPIATRYGEDLLATVELEMGTWHGKPVQLAMLDALQARGDEPLLRRFGTRLPDAQLRQQSQRRVLRLRVAASPFHEVRDNGAAVEEIVIKLGRYPISPAKYPPLLRGSLAQGKLPLRGVLVKQDVAAQSATLYGYSGDRPTVSVLPELSLRNAVYFELKGISKPVTLCGSAKELDPTPCLDAGEVKLGNPMAYLDADGAFHFTEHTSARLAAVLAQGGDSFLMPVTVGERTMLTMKWGLWFERPTQDLVFSGSSPGANAPNLHVVVDCRNPNRLVYSVSAPDGAHHAVVQMADAKAFHVFSRGAQGFTGRAGYPGRDGAPGYAGTGASCPSTSATSGSAGGPGTNGGPGGPGGPGGNGGNITVQMVCNGRDCDDTLNLLDETIQSHAGAAGLPGPGGHGGVGGAGGRGGGGASCYSDGTTFSIPSAPDGPRGVDGYRGQDGPPGTPGRRGRVTFDSR